MTGIYDKGSGALVVTENRAVDAATGEPLVTSRSGMFIRGQGGFGGPRGESEPWQLPERAPDVQITQQTRPEQALLYRLSGDRNPLHADPQFAARGGFQRPILHGLCTYGFTGRALLHALCESDPARFRSMSGRFSSPVLPGDPLSVAVWIEPGGGSALFRTAREDGTVVIDRGRIQFGLRAQAAPAAVPEAAPAPAARRLRRLLPRLRNGADPDRDGASGGLLALVGRPRRPACSPSAAFTCRTGDGCWPSRPPRSSRPAPGQ